MRIRIRIRMNGISAVHFNWFYFFADADMRIRIRMNGISAVHFNWFYFFADADTDTDTDRWNSSLILTSYRPGNIRGLVDVCILNQLEELTKTGNSWLTDEHIKGLIFETLAAV
ncbi:hypothetical protein DPMN_007165 [Dreissena polymorpha]|uniref:Uncharacterized protein n=1 Tax=Dreissena polymorpha TaxID=45954 RepID=A0A9D4MWK3_DREPO|nr:hypothetical protein DPMN_007165 [Dreissena polymorpha]